MNPIQALIKIGIYLRTKPPPNRHRHEPDLDISLALLSLSNFMERNEAIITILYEGEQELRSKTLGKAKPN